MHRRFTTALAVGTLAVTLLAGQALPASAGSATNGGLTITAADREQLPACYDYQNMTYLVTLAPDISWNLNVDVIGADGVGAAFDYGSGVGPKSGLLSANLCSSLDGPGTYTVRAVLTSTDADSNPLPNVEAYTTFLLSAPYVAPAPAPAPAPASPVATTTGIAIVRASGSEVTTLRRGKVAYVFTLVARANSGLNGARVTLQSHRSHRPWSTVMTLTTVTMAGHKGMAGVKVGPLHKTYYRWVFRGTATSKPSTSRTMKITVLR